MPGLGADRCVIRLMRENVKDSRAVGQLWGNKQLGVPIA
jgi:hypothetical protein